MKRFQTDLPAMYGDHHVIEVRRILQELTGIENIFASSAFQYLEVDYDENQTGEQDIIATLENAGYTGEMTFIEESSLPATETKNEKAFRHTAAFEQTKQVSFHQATVDNSRPLWPCPGFGTIAKKMEE